MADFKDFFAPDSSDDEGLVGVARDLIVNNAGGDDDQEGVLNVVAALEDANADARTCVERYVEDVVPLYSDAQFIRHFRVQRSLADDLDWQFEESEIFKALGPAGNETISPTKHILAYLWFVGHEAASYTDVADRFDLSLDALFNLITRVTDFLMVLAPQVIRLPTFEEKEVTRAHFLQKKGFPGVIGAIDGSHIRLDKPSEDPDAYINRKQYYSVVHQQLVNDKRKFLDVFIGYPGSVHDARVFRNSFLKDALDALCNDGSYILGDSAYPCTTSLIVSYRDNGHLSRAQRRFNTALSSCRVVVENAIGILKQRFRQLYHLKLRNMTWLVQVIHASCCGLHNLADEDDLRHLEPPMEDDYPDEEARLRRLVAAERSSRNLTMEGTCGTNYAVVWPLLVRSDLFVSLNSDF